MIVCIQGLGNLLIFLLGVALIAGGGGLTIFNIKGERGGKKGILFLAWGFSRLVIASLLCDSLTPIDVVHSIKTPSSCNLYLGKH